MGSVKGQMCGWGLVPWGWTDRRGTSSIVQSVPVAEPLTSPALVLKGRLEVWDDGDDVFLKESRQAEGHGVDLDRRKIIWNEFTGLFYYFLLHTLCSCIKDLVFNLMRHLWFLVGCVCFRVAENEADVFGKLHRVFVISCYQCFWHSAQIHGSVDDVPIVLKKTKKRFTLMLPPFLLTPFKNILKCFPTSVDFFTGYSKRSTGCLNGSESGESIIRRSSSRHWPLHALTSKATPRLFEFELVRWQRDNDII